MKIKLWQFELEIEEIIIYAILTFIFLILLGMGIGWVAEKEAEDKIECMTTHSPIECRAMGF